MLGTDCVNIDGVTILNGYADGIDPDACRNVRIANCHIESVDDAIVPKASFSLGERRSTENITVTNCYLSTACNAFKLGTESGGDFKRIAVSNCVMTGLPSRRPASSGIAIESVDGANIDGVVVSNITMVDVRAPIFIRLGNRGRDMETPVAGSLKNVSISNIVATNASLNCSITGVPGARVEGVTVSGVRIAFWGGGPFRAIDAAVPENIKRYPDADMFDGLPGYGFYCRHAHGLSLSDINLTYGEGFWRLDDEKDSKTNWRKPGGLPEPSSPGRPGPAVVCEDVDGIKISGLAARPSADDPVIVFRDVRNALVTQCMLAEKAVAFLDVAGKQSDAIHMAGNLISGAGKTFTVGSGARKKCVSESGDLVK
jgi:hypothetical protein